MKLITKLTVFIVFILSTFLFLNFYKYYDDMSIPGYKEGFRIMNWDKQISKDEVNNLLIKLAKEHDVSIIRMNESYEGQEKVKYLVNYHSLKNEGFSEKPFSRGKEYKILDKNSEEIKKLTLDGSVFYTNNPPPQSFFEVLETQGVTVTYFNQPFYFVFIDYISIFQLIPSIIILLVILLTSIIYDQISSLKDMSIKRLHGYSTKKLLSIQMFKMTNVFTKCFIFIVLIIISVLYFYNHLAQYKHVLFSFLVFSILFYSILALNIFIAYLLINKETYHMQKYIKYDGVGNSFQYLPNLIKIIVTLTLINVITSSLYNFKLLNEHLESEKYWIKNNDLYMTEISNVEGGNDYEKFENVDKTISTLIKNIPENHWLLSFHQNYDWKNEGKNYTLENSIFINETFIERNNIKINNTNKINSSKITILIPKNVYNETIKQNLKKEMIDRIDFYDELKKIKQKEKYHDIDIIDYENHESVFNFNGRTNLENSFSHNPILIILPSNLDLFSVKTAAASQGLLLFKDYDLIKKKIETHNLDVEIKGLTNIYSEVSQTIQQLKLNLTINLTTSIIGFFVLFSVYVFTIALYCDSEKKNIYVKTIHGYSFMKKHGRFILLSTISTTIALLIMMYFNILSFSGPFTGLIIVYEFVAILLIVSRFELALLKDVRRGES